MNADLLFAYFGEPTLWDLEQRSLAERGIEDGMQAREPRSQQAAYVAAFEQGVLFRCANEGRIAIAYGNACRCPNCHAVHHGAVGGKCFCTPLGFRLELGAEVIFGPGDPDDECAFYGAEDLRALCREGVHIQTMDGERLNERILLQ